MKVHVNVNYTITDKNGKVLVTKLHASQVKQYIEGTEMQASDELPAPVLDDAEMEPSSPVSTESPDVSV